MDQKNILLPAGEASNTAALRPSALEAKAEKEVAYTDYPKKNKY